MERPDTRDKSATDAVSVIGNGITIIGEVQCTTDLQVEGRVNGDIRCATLFLNVGGVVAGTIHADRVRVSGTVEGNIEAGDLAIEPTARVTGDILYSRLKVATGGIMEGSLKRRPTDDKVLVPEPAALKLVEPETPPAAPATPAVASVAAGSQPRRVYVD
jgi:cytoskeletal protein CcmA (bactofilin family)